MPQSLRKIVLSGQDLAKLPQPLTHEQVLELAKEQGEDISGFIHSRSDSCHRSKSNRVEPIRYSAPECKGDDANDSVETAAKNIGEASDEDAVI